MQTKDKVKMCPYCEGSIPLNALECKYCGSSLLKKAGTISPYQTEDSLASLYEPPYAPTRKATNFAIPDPEIPATLLRDPMQSEEEEEAHFNALPQKKPTTRRSPTQKRHPPQTTEESEEEESAQIGSLLLLSLGGHLFTLAWLLFFFSDHGRLVLEFKSRYWFIYLLISLPLLYKGWKKLSSNT